MFLIHITNPKSFVFNFWGSLQSLVNIIAQREVVVELLAHNYTLERTKEELDRIVVDGERRREMLRAYDEIIGVLSEAGANARCAGKIIKFLKNSTLLT